MKLQVKKVHPNATLPTYSTPGASGFDLYSVDELTMPPGGRALISTGLIFNIPEGFEIQVRPRSGMALKHGITVLNSPGTVDVDYRGTVGVILINHSHDNYSISKGDRIAQGVLAAVCSQASFEEVDMLEEWETQRDPSGFGSSGYDANTISYKPKFT